MSQRSLNGNSRFLSERFGKTFNRLERASSPNTTRRKAGSLTHGRRCHLEPLENRMLLASDVVISEFMASNDSVISDEDGFKADWIELLNTSNQEFDLAGWHLTDDSAELDKWEFPSVRLSAGESTIVFASGKDRTGEVLHTNFRLSIDGEYLALVQPDGTTVADVYEIYPEQYPDVSYGPQQETIVYEYVTADAPSKVLLPASEAEHVPTETWTAVDFDDSGWLSANTPVGYDTDVEDGDFGAILGMGGELTSMREAASSALVRTEFEIPGDTVPTLNTLNLDVNYDDGFVAFLNGSEIARANAPDALAWDSTATEEHGGVAEKREYANFVDLDDQDDFMLVGDAKWFFGRLQLTTDRADDQTSAVWTRDAIPFGGDYSFSTSMEMDIYGSSRGREGMTFVLQSGGNTRLGEGGGSLGLENAGMTYVAIELDTSAEGIFDDGPEYDNHIGINTSADGSVKRVEIDRFAGSTAGAGVHYMWIDYNGLSDMMDVYFSELNEKPEVPTLSAEVDLEELFEGTPDLWVGFTATNSDQRSNAHDITAWSFVSGAGQLGLDPVSIDVSKHTDLLRPGKNILSVHGLNLSEVDEDFVVGAQLHATETVLTDRMYFSDPSPGDVNGLGGLPPSGTVEFSVGTKVFDEPFSVAITPETPGATIRYTTDGSIPDETSELYTGPIMVEESSRLRARAFEEDRDPGPLSSVGYIQLDPSVMDFENNAPFNTSLPLMVFESYRGGVDRSSRDLVPTTGIFISPGEDGKASITDEPDFAGRTGLRIRGQSSEGWPKHQYALEIWEEGNDDSGRIPASEAEDLAIPLFGLPRESDWVLNAPYSDKTQLNNYLSFQWSNEMGLQAPRTRLVEVFVNDNGGTLDFERDYRGTYVVLEKIKVDENRVDITPISPNDNSEPEITGGYIWKKDKSGAGDVVITTDSRQQLRMVEPQRDNEITDEQKAWLLDHINEFEAALFGSDFADPDEGYAKYIDVDSWIDTWILVEMTKQIDGFRLSTYYYKDRGGKIKQGPPWDYNLSLVNANYLRGAYADGWYGQTISGGDYPYWDRLFEDPEFSQRLTDRWQELRTTIFTTDQMLADVDAAVDLLSDGNPNLDRPAEGEPSNPISRNFTRWRSTIDRYLWPNCYFGEGDCPSESPLESPENPQGRPQTYGDYIFLMKDFIEKRFAWMDDQFIAQPTANVPSGIVPAQTEVTLDSEQGVVVYTTNGRDPREFVTGAQEDTYLASGAPTETMVPTAIDSFVRTIVDTCDGPNLANPDNCMMSPNYTLGTHGETWTSGPTPIGFDSRDDFTSIIQTDIGPQMDNLNTSAYMRVPFEVTQDNLDNAAQLTLNMRYDDGFIAYLWSDELNLPVEIARANADGDPQTVPISPLPATSNAARSHSNSRAVVYEEFDITDAMQYLRTGTNYLFLHGMNSSLSNHDFLMDPMIVAKRKLSDLPDGVFQYDGPITVEENTQLVARTYDPELDTFSGPSTLSYLIEEPQLIVTEINYNPHEPTADEQAAGVTDGEQFEFIELQNTGPTDANLVGSHFTNGVEFTFGDVALAAGERAVIVSDQAAFQLRYGTDIPVAGVYDGNLNDDGEGITITDSLGMDIVNFTYRDGALWPQSADGLGATLQLVDDANTPASELGKHYHWRGSTDVGGSPGSEGTASLGVVVNEVMSNPAGQDGRDAIELHNTSTQDVSVAGWYLSDSGTTPLKYRIPDGTSIPAGGYLVVDESQFNAENSGENGFALSGSRGDDVWLVIADGQGGVASFADDVHFGAAANGESLGRMPNGSGRLAPMSAVTLGAANAAPRVGPIVISEVHYNPGDPSSDALAIDPDLSSGDLEFVEIHNSAGETQDLLNWRISGGVTHDFEFSTPVASNASVIMVTFDPRDADNATRLQAFRTHYGISDAFAIDGPLQGRLDNAGERVSLLRAGAPTGDDANFIPLVLEDEVVYDNLAPWPTDANGLQKSLTRGVLTSHGNDPASWSAADPTPGVIADFVAQPGDANMDRQFDQKDIVAVLQGGKYLTGDPATWSEGDWNGDNVFDQLDIVAAQQTGNYLQGPYASLAKSARHDIEHWVDEVFKLI